MGFMDTCKCVVVLLALQAVGSLHQARRCVIALQVLAGRGVRILRRDVGLSQALAGNVDMAH